MAPLHCTKRTGFLVSPGECLDCGPQYFIPLEVWVKKCAAARKPERVIGVALNYLASVKKTPLEITAIEICPHRVLKVVGEEKLGERQKSENPADSAWSKNVPAIYNMLKSFNVETAHQILLDKADDDFCYNGPLRLFSEKDFECLRDAEAVVQLMWNDHRTVESVVSQIELTEFDD